MQINKGTTTENLTQAIGLLVDQKQNSLRSTTFAVVTRVNSDSNGNYIAHTINALPLVQERINTQYNGKQYQPLPELYNIPYVSTPSPQVGQYCILIHLDRSITGGKVVMVEREDGTQYPQIKTTKSAHRLADCVAICGIQVDWLDEEVTRKTNKVVNNYSINNPSVSTLSDDLRIADLEERVAQLETILLNKEGNTNG